MKKTILATAAVAFGAAIMPLSVHADTKPSNDNQTNIVTTTKNSAYQQLLATDENLKQQIKTLSTSSNITSSQSQARLASLKVHELNVKSQIQVVDTKTDNDNKAAQTAKDEADAKAKAEAEAKASSDAEAKAKSDAASQLSSSASSSSSALSSALSSSSSSSSSSSDAASSASSNQTTPVSSVTDTSNTSDVRSKLVSYAESFKGLPYVWGGSTPSGFDCSGLTSYVYAHVTGKNIGRTTWNQDNSGTHISLSDLKPGDLILEYGKGHVAMYVGNGMQVEAPQPGDNISVNPVPYQYGAMYGLRYVE